MKKQNKCQSIAKGSGKQCANNAMHGVLFCWTHYPKKQTIGLTVISALLGVVFTFIGQFVYDISTYSAEEKHIDSVKKFVKEQEEVNVPNIVGLRIIGKSPDFKFVIKNIGKKPATKVKLIFADNSTPNIFSNNYISVASEIPNGVEYTLPLNLFSGVKMLMKLPNYDKGKLQELLEKFNSGRMVFIPRFYVEYYFDDKKFISDHYYLVIDNNKRLKYFGKEKFTSNK